MGIEPPRYGSAFALRDLAKVTGVEQHGTAVLCAMVARSRPSGRPVQDTALLFLGPAGIAVRAGHQLSLAGRLGLRTRQLATSHAALRWRP